MEKTIKEIEDHLKAHGKTLDATNVYPVNVEGKPVTHFITILAHSDEAGEEQFVAKVLGEYWSIFAQI